MSPTAPEVCLPRHKAKCFLRDGLQWEFMQAKANRPKATQVEALLSSTTGPGLLSQEGLKGKLQGWGLSEAKQRDLRARCASVCRKLHSWQRFSYRKSNSSLWLGEDIPLSTPKGQKVWSLAPVP